MLAGGKLGRKRIKTKKKYRIPNRGLDESKLTLVSYDIVFEPIEDESDRDVDPELAKEREEIYYRLRKHPKECASRLEPLIEKYPDIPALYNHLSVAYRLTGEKEKARDLILETYRKFPDYLFAKLGYVELCLVENNLDEIPRILDNKYDLQVHYPERTKFHITEFTSFVGTVGFYFCKAGRPEVAKIYHQMLSDVAPDDPQTKRLERALKASASLGILSNLARWLDK